MCGIAGLFRTDGRDHIDRSLLKRMNGSQTHRGPDASGIFENNVVGLAHRRLSIIDLSDGDQPIFNEDGSVAVVYNGEIYNFQELTAELTAKGHQFSTHCDTEVIVHAWEEWGPACVERFRGMFSFALWDENKRTLMLARDRFGIKPLYYGVRSDSTLVFGSELKSLLCDPAIRREIDPRAVEEYFAFGYVPDPRTIYTSVQKLPPGHFLVWRVGQVRQEPVRYWDISFRPAQSRSEAEIKSELIDKLRDAVKCRMIADVPLGAFLSGGVDSSAIVALMAELSPDKVRSCSISFGDPAFDESRFADQVAAHIGTDHRSERVDSDDFDLIDRLATTYDEPFADSSAIPTFRVCELARRHVTVALSGDGGDEVFAGYRRYYWHQNEERLRRALPLPVRRIVFGALGQIYPKLDRAPRMFRAKSTFQSLARDSIGAYFHSVSVVYDGIRETLYNPDFRNSLDGYNAEQVLRTHMGAADTDDPVSQIQYADMKTYLPGDILTKVDRASMAHSLEVRVPLLDHPFAEWGAGLAPDMKMRGREGKYIFKKALEPLLPEDILYRPKMGFAVPLASWFRNELRDRLRSAIKSPALKDSGIFDLQYLERLTDDHQSGARDHSAILWSVLMFEAFLRKVHQ